MVRDFVDKVLTELELYTRSSDFNTWVLANTDSQPFTRTDPFVCRIKGELRSQTDFSKNLGCVSASRLIQWGLATYDLSPETFSHTHSTGCGGDVLARLNKLVIGKMLPTSDSICELLERSVLSLHEDEFHLFRSILLDIWKHRQFMALLDFEEVLESHNNKDSLFQESGGNETTFVANVMDYYLKKANADPAPNEENAAPVRHVTSSSSSSNEKISTPKQKSDSDESDHSDSDSKQHDEDKNIRTFKGSKASNKSFGESFADAKRPRGKEDSHVDQQTSSSKKNKFKSSLSNSSTLQRSHVQGQTKSDQAKKATKPVQHKKIDTNKGQDGNI